MSFLLTIAEDDVERGILLPAQDAQFFEQGRGFGGLRIGGRQSG